MAIIWNRLSSKAVAVALGQELLRMREARGWSRPQMVALLPSGIGERTLLSYEHGTRQLSVIRLIELCEVLGVDVSTFLADALQRVRIYIENMPLSVDLNALLKKGGGEPFGQLSQWAQNALEQYTDGYIKLAPSAVQSLALFIGCTHEELRDYLAGFLPGSENTTKVKRRGRKPSKVTDQ
ncbi:MAG TPA: helix-turn-helix transcriptional regulator [Candidatus Saccharimonadales bacterium]